MERGSESSVAVFMPTARCGQWLDAAILSVIHQTYTPTDLYVVDDAAGDVDAGLISRYPSVNFLRMKTAAGPYTIANLLLRQTRSAFVAFHDADDTSHPQRLQSQISFLDDFDGCGSWVVNVDADGEALGYDTFPTRASDYLDQDRLFALLHPSSLFRRAVLDALGGFDGGTRFGADTEFLYRCALRFNIGNVQRFLYRHTIHPASLTQARDTGFASEARKLYDDALRQNIEAIRAGTQPQPAQGQLLNGKSAGLLSADGFEVMQLAPGNTTWKR